MNENLKQILLTRNILTVDEYVDTHITGPMSHETAKLNVFILTKMGVYVDRPQDLKPSHVEQLATILHERVPAGFYENPQHTKYYSASELLIEQLVSYFIVECIGGVNSLNSEIFKRIPLFEKELPEYKDGDEMQLRLFAIMSLSDANEKLVSIYKNLAQYTRPWNPTELSTFVTLDTELETAASISLVKSKSNVVALIKTDAKRYSKFAQIFDWKDVVKLSVGFVGERSEVNFSPQHIEILKEITKMAKSCPLTKKQAKYYKTILKKIGQKSSMIGINNDRSPYRIANVLVNNNQLLEAAQFLSEHGSLLERNIVWLASRTKTNGQLMRLISSLRPKNPLVLLQLVNTLATTVYSQPRVFKFNKNGRAKCHIETGYEALHRKSTLSDEQMSIISASLQAAFESAIKELPKLGKVYADENFKKIALPMNTSANATGLSVIPTGSRIPITSDNIRVFTHWKDVYDIDLSMTAVYDFDTHSTVSLSFHNYHRKDFGDAALHSGDVRGHEGAEYIDINLVKLRELKAYKYLFFQINGYNSLIGPKVYMGYQNKNDLNTTVWSQKNIALQIKCNAEARVFIGFAIDLETNEIVILNETTASESRVVNNHGVHMYKNVFAPDFLRYNMYEIAKLRGEFVETPEEADIVLSDTFEKTSDKKVIRSFESDALITLIN